MPKERCHFVHFRTETCSPDAISRETFMWRSSPKRTLLQRSGALWTVSAHRWGLFPIKSAVFLHLGVSDALAFPAACVQARAKLRCPLHLFGWGYYSGSMRGWPRKLPCHSLSTPLDIGSGGSEWVRPRVPTVLTPSQELRPRLPWERLSLSAHFLDTPRL